jgi:hypothetical protein
MTTSTALLCVAALALVVGIVAATPTLFRPMPAAPVPAVVDRFDSSPRPAPAVSDYYRPSSPAQGPSPSLLDAYGVGGDHR